MLINCSFFFTDLAAIRRLLDSETSGGGTTCPSCEMPFDKGKKRRLIDTCGHERCYTCMFTNEACPLCNGRNQLIDQQNNIATKTAGTYLKLQFFKAKICKCLKPFYHTPYF